jgi:hypothetical protein
VFAYCYAAERRIATTLVFGPGFLVASYPWLIPPSNFRAEVESADRRRSRRILGRRQEWTPTTGWFFVRLLWSYIHPLRTKLAGPQDEVVQVFAEDASRFRELLTTTKADDRPPGSRLRRYVLFEDDDPDWPGLVVRATATDSYVAARVSTVPLAKSISDRLNRVAEASARKPRSWGSWWRFF